jgi:hypothetical protein
MRNVTRGQSTAYAQNSEFRLRYRGVYLFFCGSFFVGFYGKHKGHKDLYRWLLLRTQRRIYTSIYAPNSVTFVDPPCPLYLYFYHSKRNAIAPRNPPSAFRNLSGFSQNKIFSTPFFFTVRINFFCQSFPRNCSALYTTSDFPEV